MRLYDALCRRLESEPVKGTDLYGRLFEHFVLLEIFRLNKYTKKDWSLSYWRTSQGAEVDMVLETGKQLWAIEIKSRNSIRTSDLRGLHSFLEDYKGAKGLCICTADRAYEVDGIECLPWRDFFKKLFPSASAPERVSFGNKSQLI